MPKKSAISKQQIAKPVQHSIYDRICAILESAQIQVARSVNSTQVVANWLIGREIVEEQQSGRERAVYGEQLIEELSIRMKASFGKGFSVNNLEHFRSFYLIYPELLGQSISHAARGELASLSIPKISHAARGKSTRAKSIDSLLPSPSLSPLSILEATATQKAWQPGRLNPNLSWTHYRTLLRVESSDARSFYEIEALENHWSARELEQQINSLLFERLAKSRDKKGLMKLATKGQQVTSPLDVFKDPVVIEFLGLPESPKLVESDLETALINDLQSFLLELGKGFAFVVRQQRITLDGDHFYIELVFYHTILKCFVLIDLKIGKLTHQDLGQLQLYVNYYDAQQRTQGDQPTLGLILRTDKNDAMVKYTLGPEHSQKLFASRYKLHVPSEKVLLAEIHRELKQLTPIEKRIPSKRKSS